MTKPFARCVGSITLNDDFEECPVCGWVNDGVQRADPDYRGGYNRISLNEAKKKFAAGKKVFD